MNAWSQRARQITRRYFLQSCQVGLGALALGCLDQRAARSGDRPAPADEPLAPEQPLHPAKAKHVIYLHMAGSPPQQDLFDYKPALVKHICNPAPTSCWRCSNRNVWRSSTLKQRRPQLLGTPYKFAAVRRVGDQSANCSPNFASRADDICLIRSMHTDQFNHAPAQLLLYTGAPRFGNASMGSWVTYGSGIGQ